MDAEGIETFEAGGEKYTAVFGFRAMKAVEEAFDLPFMQALAKAMPQVSAADLADRDKVLAAASRIKFSDVSKLFEASLLKHHPELTEAEIDELVDEVGLGKVTAIIGRTVAAALVQEGDAGSPENPPGAPKGRRKK